jgi:hypothetical protein
MAIASEVEELFERLSRSDFRSRLGLGREEREYLVAKGWGTILLHANDFLQSRLAPASPRNDGKQTPMKGHPVFIAQHATATGCRRCLAKWDGIARGIGLDVHQVDHLVDVIRYWLEGQTGGRH